MSSYLSKIFCLGIFLLSTIAIADDFLQTRLPKRAKRSVLLHIEFEDEPNRMTVEEFWEFCQENGKINAELTKRRRCDYYAADRMGHKRQKF